MSYILEALKKSEAERRLGEVPALSASAVAPPASGGESRPRRRNGWRWTGLLGLLLLLNLVLTAWLVGSRLSEETGRPVSAPRASPRLAAPAEVPAPELRGRAETPPSPVAAPPAPAVLYPERLSISEAPPGTAEKGAPAPSPGAAAVETRAKAREPAPEAEEAVPGWDQLPASLRSRIRRPRLDVHVYDLNPARRFVRLDLRKYVEGERTAEGLLVERITREGVILSLEGSRFLLARP